MNESKEALQAAVGKTVRKIDVLANNYAQITFTDGTSLLIDADSERFGGVNIPRLILRLAGPKKTKPSKKPNVFPGFTPDEPPMG